MTTPALGDRLYRHVESYASLGDHRSGSIVERATTSWLADECTSRGLKVRVTKVPFEQCRIESSLVSNGEALDHLAVPYEFQGSIAASAGPVLLDVGFGGHPETLDKAIAKHRLSSPDPLVFATAHSDGSLVAVNRRIRPGSGVPTFLIAQRDHAATAAHGVSITANATYAAGETTTVVASNTVAGPKIVLTTPLNGWFRCAGERATGIAVLLHLIERFSHLPLLVVATGGHELGAFGADHFLAGGFAENGPIAAIVHLGASIAADERSPEGRRLAQTRLAMTSITAAQAESARDALVAASYNLVTESSRWVGEATTWAKTGLPLLSFSGAGADFHTPEDTPERATSPSSLRLATDAVAATIDAFVEVANGLSTAPPDL